MGKNGVIFPPPPPQHISAVARRVLAQPVCASAAERNWSVYGAIKTTARGQMGHAVAPTSASTATRRSTPQGQASDRRLQAGGREVGHRLRLGQLGRGGPQDVRQALRRQGRCGGVGGGDAAVSTSDATRGTSLRCAPRTHARGSHARARTRACAYSLIAYTQSARAFRACPAEYKYYPF